ncbi:MAG: xanthine dehydrogenase family protein subunit M [Acidimicrobiia bacterium]
MPANEGVVPPAGALLCSATVKPPPFRYVAPRSLEEALTVLAEHADDAKVLAGGQSMVPLLSLRLASPSVLVDLSHVGGLDGIEADDDTVTIGAMVRQRAAERSDVVQDRVPLLSAALPYIGHPAIRNRGTVGGSIAHADPSAEIPTVALALDAEVVATSAAAGERRIPAADLFEGFLTTSLREDEVLTAVRMPVTAPGTGVAFEEVARRHGDFALVGTAAVVRLADGKVAEARLAVMGVGGTPVRAHAAEAALMGASPGDEAFGAAAESAADGLDPASDLHGSAAYRTHLAKVVVRRALARAAAGAAASTNGGS